MQITGKKIFKQATATMTITTGGAMGNGDFIGVDHTSMTFAGCASRPGGTGEIKSAIFIDGDKQSIAGELWLFTVAPAGLPDQNLAFTVTDADMLSCIGYITFTTYVASGANGICLVNPVAPIHFQCADASQALYGAFVTRGTPTYTTAVPMFVLNILQDP
jgi:hypothetical protein